MCEPTTIILLTTAVVSAAMAARSANQQKHAVEAQAREQQTQTDESASAQTEDRLAAAREQRSAARAASAESGASGNSTDAILNDIMMQSGRDVSRIEKNRENGQRETQQQVRSRTSEINGQLAAGLASSAETGASGYARYSSVKTPPTIPQAPTYANGGRGPY